MKKLILGALFGALMMFISPSAQAQSVENIGGGCVQTISLLVLSFPVEDRTCHRHWTTNILATTFRDPRVAGEYLCRSSPTYVRWKMARSGLWCSGTTLLGGKYYKKGAVTDGPRALARRLAIFDTGIAEMKAWK